MSDRKRKPVLLTADDDRVIRAVVEELFRDDATVLFAHDGLEALGIMHKDRPDIVLLDDAMPGLMGLQLLEIMQKNGDLDDIAVVMLTASNRPDEIARAMAAGAVDHVAKPFNPAALAVKVRGLLKRLSYVALIAVEDVSLATRIEEILSACRIRTVRAKNAGQISSYIADHDPHLVILDWRSGMPPQIATGKDIPALYLAPADIARFMPNAVALPLDPGELLRRCFHLIGLPENRG